jgi:L-2-hydroxyglutarate oxidase LhgO
MSSNPYDLAIVGGGIIGLATAMELVERFPKAGLIVLEKEDQLARHQTGHNSGVIHSGVYYKPGSMKAFTCAQGRKSLLDFCDQSDIPYNLCGKVIVATREEEIPRLEEIFRRGQANGVQGLQIIGPEQMKEIEPHAAGKKALRVPTAGIIDFTRVAQAYAARIRSLGGEILTSHEVRDIVPADGQLVVETTAGDFRTKYLINCAGLFSDQVARMTAQHTSPKIRGLEELRIIPFRGEYYSIVPERRSLVRSLIYPVPDPQFPFLGVHFTRTIQGDVEAGPNAVLAFAREGYRSADINLYDLWNMVTYRGFWLMAKKYWKTGVEEMQRSISKGAFVKSLQQLVPGVQAGDLVPGGSGVRAQAVSANGVLVDDFLFLQTADAVHVLNAPSPGATASLAIGKRIVDTAAKTFDLQN